jgi:hypothetical protein
MARHGKSGCLATGCAGNLVNPLNTLYNPNTNTCDVPCPSDAIEGTYAPKCGCYPNKVNPLNIVYNSSTNQCVPDCPKGTISGTYPSCVCQIGYTFNLAKNACEATLCPSDATKGVYAPECSCSGNLTNPLNTIYNSSTNQCVPLCPKGSLGIYPSCVCDIKGYSFDAYSNTCDSCANYKLLGTYPSCSCLEKYTYFLIPEHTCAALPKCDPISVSIKNYPYCECNAEATAKGYIMEPVKRICYYP